VQVAFEGGVVGLGGGDDGLEQDPSVDGQPPSTTVGGAVSAVTGEGLDLVSHGDVGVQVGVAGAGVAVGERGRDEAADLDLPHSVRPDPGE